MPSKYIGRYPSPGLLRWLVEQDSLYTAPDLPHDHAFCGLIRAMINGGEPPDGPIVLGRFSNPGNIRAAKFALIMAESVKLKVEVRAGTGNNCLLRRVGKADLIDISSNDCVVVVHELGHALFGPSEAVAQAWAIRQIMRATGLKPDLTYYHPIFRRA